MKKLSVILLLAVLLCGCDDDKTYASTTVNNYCEWKEFDPHRLGEYMEWLDGGGFRWTGPCGQSYCFKPVPCETPAPEPATLALGTLGVALVHRLRRRRML